MTIQLNRLKFFTCSLITLSKVFPSRRPGKYQIFGFSYCKGKKVHHNIHTSTLMMFSCKCRCFCSNFLKLCRKQSHQEDIHEGGSLHTGRDRDNADVNRGNSVSQCCEDVQQDNPNIRPSRIIKVKNTRFTVSTPGTSPDFKNSKPTSSPLSGNRSSRSGTHHPTNEGGEGTSQTHVQHPSQRLVDLTHLQLKQLILSYDESSCETDTCSK